MMELTGAITLTSVILIACLLSPSYVAAQCKGDGYDKPLPAPRLTDILFPLPSSVAFGTSTSPLSDSFTITTSSSSATLQVAIERYLVIIRTLSLSFPGTLLYGPRADGIASLAVSVLSNKEELQYGIDESYSLNVSAASATLVAQTVYGAIRGLETFSQLVANNNGQLVVRGVPWVIADKPRYSHRGILLDTSRHFLPVTAILRTIAGMSYSKMNVLHWHLTDAQSFPFNVDAYPKLVDAAFSPEETYSTTDFQNIVKFATQYGVRVVVEVDMPGHTSSFGVGYPEITVCRDKTREQNYCAENPCGELDPSNPLTFTVIEAIVKQLTQIFPDNFFHFGSDEVVYQCWNTPHINAWMKQQNLTSYPAVLGYFTNRVHQIAAKYNREPINWEEIFDEKLPVSTHNATVNVWKSFAVLSQVVKAGYRAILSNYDAWYLDCGYGGWCPYCTWLDIWLNDPLTGSNLTPAQQALILGGEVSLWGELVTERNLDGRLWPRASAAGERLWSPRSVTDQGDAFVRLNKHNCRLALRGFESESLIPGSTVKQCHLLQG